MQRINPKYVITDETSSCRRSFEDKCNPGTRFCQVEVDLFSMLFAQCSILALYSLNLVKLKFPVLTTEDNLSVKKQPTFQNAATGSPRNDLKAERPQNFHSDEGSLARSGYSGSHWLVKPIRSTYYSVNSFTENQG